MSADSARLFVALELPDEARTALTDWGRHQLAALPEVRLLDAGSLHVTLCFLGSRPLGELADIAAVCRGLAPAPAPGLSIGPPLWLPRHQPRVLAVELADEDGTLATMQSSLAGALEAGGFYVREERPFLAHVTVARVGRHARVKPGPLAPTDPLRFRGTTVILYRSRLGHGGARYEPLETVALTGPG